MMVFWLFIFMVEDEYLVKTVVSFICEPTIEKSQRYTTLVWEQHFLKWTVSWAFYVGKSVN